MTIVFHAVFSSNLLDTINLFAKFNFWGNLCLNLLITRLIGTINITLPVGLLLKV